MNALAPIDDPFCLEDIDDPLAAAITKRPPNTKFIRLGINQVGQLYEYGESHATPKRVLSSPDDGLNFLGVHDIKAFERQGDRRKLYLDVTLGSPHPYHIFVLSLPVFNCKPDRSSWPVRTLLGSLATADRMLDMRAMAGTICARRGTKPNAYGHVANFIDLFVYGELGGEAPARVSSQAIDPDRHTLEVTVDRLRRSLDLEPQFQ
jgi:hypothetical protein